MLFSSTVTVDSGNDIIIYIAYITVILKITEILKKNYLNLINRNRFHEQQQVFLISILYYEQYNIQNFQALEVVIIMIFILICCLVIHSCIEFINEHHGAGHYLEMQKAWL